MPFDPKVLTSATQKIDLQLASFEKRRVAVAKESAQAKKRLAAIEKAFGVFRGTAQSLVQDLGAAAVEVQGAMGVLDAITLKAGKPSPEYDQIQRRYLDSKKTAKDVADNYDEKSKAHVKNKADKKALMEYELAEKAGNKIVTDFGNLQQQAQALLNTKDARLAASVCEALPDLLTRYETALKTMVSVLAGPKALLALNSELGKVLAP